MWVKCQESKKKKKKKKSIQSSIEKRDMKNCGNVFENSLVFSSFFFRASLFLWIFIQFFYLAFHQTHSCGCATFSLWISFAMMNKWVPMVDLHGNCVKRIANAKWRWNFTFLPPGAFYYLANVQRKSIVIVRHIIIVKDNRVCELWAGWAVHYTWYRIRCYSIWNLYIKILKFTATKFFRNIFSLLFSFR